MHPTFTAPKILEKPSYDCSRSGRLSIVTPRTGFASTLRPFVGRSNSGMLPSVILSARRFLFSEGSTWMSNLDSLSLWLALVRCSIASLALSM